MTYTALVTGADHGIGFELVRRLLKDGYRVFAGKYSKTENLLDELMSRFGDRLIPVELDVGLDDSVEKAARKVREHADSLDLLINNAAILGDIKATVRDDLNFAEMLEVFNVNALGSLRVTHALIGQILNGKHRMIVNISSEAGSISQCFRESWYAYAMSKAALNMQSNLVYNGIKNIGGQVLVIHPGWVQTYMRGERDAEAPLTPEQSAGRIVDIIRDRLSRSGNDAVPPELLSAEGGIVPW